MRVPIALALLGTVRSVLIGAFVLACLVMAGAVAPLAAVLYGVLVLLLGAGFGLTLRWLASRAQGPTGH